MTPATPVEDTRRLREQVIAACLELEEIGHFVGTWGNIGVRVRQGLLVTPTRMEYRAIQPADLVLVSWEGGPLAGRRLPSSEMELHRQVLLARADLGAVVHTHSPWATVVAAARRSLPVCVEDMAQVLGGEVPCARYVRGGLHAELGRAACEALGGTTSAVLLASHGAVVGGRTLAEAVVASRVLEKAACAFVMGHALGGAVPIDAEAVASERDRFLHKYGTADDK
jgi:L-fuculose-phosphate aldolase